LARVEKKAVSEGRELVFVDESGFYLLPAVVRTYAPAGKTPVLRSPLTRDHLSAISGITPTGGLFMKVQDHAFSSKEVVEFLKHLIRHIPAKILVIWDGAPIHRSKVVRQFLTEGGAQRIQLERLPGYAPDLNPDEGIWRHLKHVEMRNLCCRDMEHLKSEFRKATQRLRAKRRVILGCIRQPGYV
jgi:transposase